LTILVIVWLIVLASEESRAPSCCARPDKADEMDDARELSAPIMLLARDPRPEAMVLAKPLTADVRAETTDDSAETSELARLEMADVRVLAMDPRAEVMVLTTPEIAPTTAFTTPVMADVIVLTTLLMAVVMVEAMADSPDAIAFRTLEMAFVIVDATEDKASRTTPNAEENVDESTLNAFVIALLMASPSDERVEDMEFIREFMPELIAPVIVLMAPDIADVIELPSVLRAPRIASLRAPMKPATWSLSHVISWPRGSVIPAILQSSITFSRSS